MSKAILAKRTIATAKATVLLLAHERFIGTVYEPCRTDDGITNAVHEHGLALFMTSIPLLDYKARDIVNIITEPEIVGIEAVVAKGIDLVVRKLAMLLPLEILAKHPVVLREMPLTRVYVLSSRVLYRKGCFAWFVWEKGCVERPAIYTI